MTNELYRAVMYDCEICSERIKRNFFSISGHLAVKHRGMAMTMRDYEGRFGLTDYEVEVPADVAVAEIVRMSEPGTDAFQYCRGTLKLNNFCIDSDALKCYDITEVTIQAV